MNKPIRMTLGAVLLPLVFLVSTSYGACTYSISPSSRIHGYGAATNTVSLTAGTGCAWSVVNTNDWLWIQSATNGAGSSVVTYRVAANPDTVERTGTVTIANLSFTVRQRAVACSYSVSPVSRMHGFTMATNSISVTPNGSGCAWAVSNANNWITITSGSNGIGNGTVNYVVASNPTGNERTGVVMIADQIVTLIQHGASCSYVISPTNGLHGTGVETGLVTVTAITGCNWTAGSTNSWITITSATNGSGNGAVSYMVEANSGRNDRTGVLNIDGQVFPVTQMGNPCAAKVSPTSRFHGYAGATNTVSVSIGNGCNWNVIITNDWIIILTNGSGVSTGIVSYGVAKNSNAGSRIGVMEIGGELLTLTQWGTNCSFLLTPASRAHGSGSETGLVTVTASSSSCDWSVVNTNTWVTFPSATNGSGSGSVGYTVDANPGGSARTGMVMIDGQTFTLTQQGASNVFAFDAVAIQNGRDLRVRLTGAPTGVWELQGSSDLVHWVRAAGFTNTPGPVDYIEPISAPPAHRFYRAVKP